jgi:hypothetical protein
LPDFDHDGRELLGKERYDDRNTLFGAIGREVAVFIND